MAVVLCAMCLRFMILSLFNYSSSKILKFAPKYRIGIIIEVEVQLFAETSRLGILVRLCHEDKNCMSNYFSTPFPAKGALYRLYSQRPVTH